MSAMTNLLR